MNEDHFCFECLMNMVVKTDFIANCETCMGSMLGRNRKVSAWKSHCVERRTRRLHFIAFHDCAVVALRDDSGIKQVLREDFHIFASGFESHFATIGRRRARRTCARSEEESKDVKEASKITCVDVDCALGCVCRFDESHHDV